MIDHRKFPLLTINLELFVREMSSLSILWVYYIRLLEKLTAHYHPWPHSQVDRPRMFPVLKIPLILAITLALHVSWTPPNPPPRESERVRKVDAMMSDRLRGLAAKYLTPVIIVRKL